MLDDFEAITDLDKSDFLHRLKNLPHSYEGPDGVQKEPYGLTAYGEAMSSANLLESWIDAPLVISGTQFFFVGGFDFGDASTLKLTSEMTDAAVITLGHGIHKPNWEVLPDVLSTYTYAGYLAHATGHKDNWQEANRLMSEIAEAVQPDVKTEDNPAKTLAWSLWNRVPLVMAARRQKGLIQVAQRLFARVGKTLAISASDHPLEVVTGAFEGRHNLGDDVVALLLGEKDEEMMIAEEVLNTRVAQFERISLPFAGIAEAPKDTATYNLVVWYLTAWVAAYCALLHKLDPQGSVVYEETRVASPYTDDNESYTEDDLSLN